MILKLTPNLHEFSLKLISNKATKNFLLYETMNESRFEVSHRSERKLMTETLLMIFEVLYNFLWDEKFLCTLRDLYSKWSTFNSLINSKKCCRIVYFHRKRIYNCKRAEFVRTPEVSENKRKWIKFWKLFLIFSKYFRKNNFTMGFSRRMSNTLAVITILNRFWMLTLATCFCDNGY